MIPFDDNLDKICISAYFQDIIVPRYDYSPFNKKYGIFNTKTCCIYCGSTCNKDCFEKYNRINIISNIKYLLIKHYNNIKNKMKI